MNGLFVSLEDEDFFVDFVGAFFRHAPEEISAVMRCRNKVDMDRLKYAFDLYKQNIERFAVLLKSSNPDHYKRAGALLQALLEAKAVSDVDLESNSDELESGYTRVHLGDAEHILPFVKFYETYFNEMMAFDLAYRCCAAYEECPREYDFDYLHNVCRYLKINANLPVDSLFMLFKSLMQ